MNRQDEYEAAEAMHRQTLAIQEKVLGPEHPETLTSVSCLAHLLRNQRSYDDSVVVYERSYAGYNTVPRKEHPTARTCG